MASSQVSSLIQQIGQIKVESLSNEDRTALRDAADVLHKAASSPFEWISRLTMDAPSIVSTLDTLIDAEFFQAWGKAGGKPTSVEELAKLTNKPFDPALLSRLLRLLVAAGIVNQDPATPGVYSRAPVSAWLEDSVNEGITHVSRDTLRPSVGHLAKFLRKIDYQNIYSPQTSNFGDAFGIQGTFYDYLYQRPDEAAKFHRGMACYEVNTPSWVETYPSETLLEGKEKGKAIVVDVGGSTGQNLKLFALKHTVPKEQVINEDRKEVIGGADAVLGNYGVSIAHNFFEEDQPVKGARAYFLSNVLHNYSEEDSVKILKNIKGAMEPGHSKILIFEIVIKSEAPSMFATSLDVSMMAILSASERTENEFKRMVELAGLKFTKVWYNPLSPRAVIEVDL